MKKYIAISRNWIDRFLKANETLGVSLLITRVNIPVPQRNRTPRTRAGSDKTDKAPFYESRFEQLAATYYAYDNSQEFKNLLLYTEVIPLVSGNLYPIDTPAKNIADISVRIAPNNYRLPSQLRPHADLAVSLFQQMGKINRDPATGEWENNTALSVRSFGENQMECRFARYFDQVATNLTLDWDSGKLPPGAHSLRAGLEKPQDGKLPKLSESVLANTLGTAVMVYNKRMQPLLRVRNPSMASIGFQGLHCSVSGVLELPDGTEPGEYGFDVFLHGTHKEIKDELGLLPHQYQLYPVAFARELPRGGKPQLFWIAIADVDDDTLKDAAAHAREGNEFVFHDFADVFKDLPKEDQNFSSKFTYEGLACLIFSEIFLDANKKMLL